MVNRENDMGCHLSQNLLVINYLLNLLLPWAAPVFSKKAKVSRMSVIGLSLIKELS